MFLSTSVPLSQRNQMNGLTAFIDGSQIYGSDKRTSFGLRDVKVLSGYLKLFRTIKLLAG